VHGSGIITIGNEKTGTLTLDFRDSKRPARIKKASVASGLPLTTNISHTIGSDI